LLSTARLEVAEVELESFPERTGGQPSAEVKQINAVLTNFGKAPATNIELAIGWTSSWPDKHGDGAEPQAMQIRGELAGGSQRSVGANCKIRIRRREDADSLPFYIYGHLVYTDTLSEQRYRDDWCYYSWVTREGRMIDPAVCPAVTETQDGRPQ